MLFQLTDADIYENIENGTVMQNFNELIFRQLKARKDIFYIEVEPDSADDNIEKIYFDGELDYYDDQCLLDGCNDKEITTLLLGFCSLKYYNFFSWQVCCELSKLLANRGKLIEKIAETFIFNDEINNFRKTSLHLAYFATDIKWASWCLKCLESCNEDFRDGLFLACYRLNTPQIYSALVRKFTDWLEKDQQWGESTGELYSLSRLIEKWNKTVGYNQHNHLQRIIKERME